MSWDFTAGNSVPPPHRSNTPSIPPMRMPTPMPNFIPASPAPSHYSHPTLDAPYHTVPPRSVPMTAPSTTPAFLEVPGTPRTIPVVTREGRSPERHHSHHHSHSHSHSSSRHRSHSQEPRHHSREGSRSGDHRHTHHSRSHSTDRHHTHHSRSNSVDPNGRGASRERHHSHERPHHSHSRHHSHDSRHHSTERHDSHRPRRHSESHPIQSTSRGMLMVKTPANTKVIVVPSRSDMKKGHLPHIYDPRKPHSTQVVTAQNLAPGTQKVLKHFIGCIHHHSATLGMESFLPRPEHPAYNPIPYPSPHSTFQYSRCTGRKRALCIGINYYGTDKPLRGCINDAIHVRDFLIKYHGFTSDNIMVLRDDTSNPNKIPTRRNMLAAMRWLVEGAQKHDSLFFHYSGHGSQIPDEDGDEIDGFDEVIFPTDHKKRGPIVDDEMHSIMVKPLPTGCRLTALFDSCHSGTVLDLPYIYTPAGRVKGIHISSRALSRKATRADVISWSGCKDDQTSADTFQGGMPVGAMSYAFISSLKKNRNQSYHTLLKTLRSLLHERFNQTPQLGSSHHIDTNLQFII